MQTEPQTVPPFGDADIAGMTDMQVPVTIGGVAGLAWVDEPIATIAGDRARNGAGVTVMVSALIVQTSKFPAAEIGAAVVLNGKSVTVRQRDQGDEDGALTKLWLEAV